MLSETIQNLETAYTLLNSELFDNSLPDVCITIQHAKKRNKKTTTLGWFSTEQVWIDGNNTEMFEINITSDCLNKSFIDIIGVLIHEMVHVYCYTHHIEDCNGKKHNEHFKAQCEAVGLSCEKEKSVGWGITAVTLDLRDKILALSLDESAFENRCEAIIIEKEPKEQKPKPVYICPGCQEKIKSKKTDLAIMCVKCNQQFELVYEETPSK